MSTYIENNLGKDEVVILEAKKSFWYIIASLVPLLVFVILAAVITVLANNAVTSLINDVTSGNLNFKIIILIILLFLVGGSETDGIEIVRAAKDKALVYVWIIFIIIALIPFILRLVKYFTTHLAITNKRIIGKSGLLRIYTLDIHIDKIDHVQVKATVLGNLFRYYGLKVMSVGGAGNEFKGRRKNKKELFMGISNAHEFKNTVNSAIERHAAEARKAQAAEIAAAMSTRPQQ